MTSGTGTCTVHYNQAGNDNYNAAPEKTEDVTAEKADQTITITTTVQYSDKVDLTASVSPTSLGGSTLTGSIQFKKSIDGGTTFANIGSPVVISGGTASLNGQQILDAPGTPVRFKAEFTSTNSNFGNSNDTKALTVTQEDGRATYTGPMLVFTPPGGSSRNDRAEGSGARRDGATCLRSVGCI